MINCLATGPSLVRPKSTTFYTLSLFCGGGEEEEEEKEEEEEEEEVMRRHGMGETEERGSYLGFVSSLSVLLERHVLFALFSWTGDFYFVATWRRCVALALVLNGLAELRGEHGRRQHINHEKGWKSIRNNFSPKSVGSGSRGNNL